MDRKRLDRYGVLFFGAAAVGDVKVRHPRGQLDYTGGGPQDAAQTVGCSITESRRKRVFRFARMPFLDLASRTMCSSQHRNQRTDRIFTPTPATTPFPNLQSAHNAGQRQSECCPSQPPKSYLFSIGEIGIVQAHPDARQLN